MEHIGFIGLGRMGQIMCEHIINAGFTLTVYNRTKSKAEGILAKGANWANSPAELAQTADIILTILTDDTAVEQVYLGENGLLSADIPNRLLIEMSTIRAEVIMKVAEQTKARGGRFLDAPVSGTLEPARLGQLMTMVGGEEADLERARPVFETFSRRIVHMGGTGRGTIMKLSLNMGMAIFWAGLAESLAMGSQAGLSMEQMLDIYLDSPVAPPALRGKAPLLLGQDHEVAFDVTGVRKDLLAMVSTAQTFGISAATGASAAALFSAATAAGYGDKDLVFAVEYMIEQARKIKP